MKIIRFTLTTRQDTVFSELVRRYHLTSFDFRCALDGVSVNVSMNSYEAEKLLLTGQAPVWLIEKIDAAAFAAEES